MNAVRSLGVFAAAASLAILGNMTAPAAAGPPSRPIAPAAVVGKTVAPHVSLQQAIAAARRWQAEQRLGARVDQSQYPVVPNIVVGIGLAALNPEVAPGGADVGCKPGLQHPYPVVLVNGTFSVMEDDFAALAPTLANAGYCVYTFNYGGAPGTLVEAIGPVTQSAATLAGFVAQVLAQTGAHKVDLVGHSQGGMLSEYYVKFLGGAAYVHDLVGLSPTTHGTTLDGLTILASTFPGASALVGIACPACADQERGSAVIKALDKGSIAQAGVTYTVIETLDEFVVTPVGSSFIHERGVTNEYVQSACPFDTVDHVDLSYDQVVFQEIFNALDPKSAQPPNCFLEFPFPA